MRTYLLDLYQSELTLIPFQSFNVSEDRKGRIYYFNCQTDESSWEHPSDHFYRSLTEQERLRGSSTTLSMSGLTSIANLHFVDEDMLFKSDNNGNGNETHFDKKSSLMDSKPNKPRNEALKNNYESEEEVESVDFELEIEEALEEMASNGEDQEELVTIDVTEGSNYDTKQFKEVHTIELNSGISNGKVKNDITYNTDNKSKSDALKSNDTVKHKIKMQNSSSSPEHRLSQNTNQSTANQRERNNEVSDDEFLLDVREDPFAEYDLNVNDLFRTNTTPSKYDVSDDSKQTSAAKSSNSYPTAKPLETLVETSEKDENGLQSYEDQSQRNESEGDDEEGEYIEEDLIQEEDNQNDNNIHELNNEEIEYKFEEMSNTLSAKIASLREGLREEIRKQRNAINKEIKEQMNDLNDKVNKNKKDLNETKSEIVELRRSITNNSKETTIDVTNRTDIDSIAREMQLLRSDVREESMQSIRELRNELNRDIKMRVNTAVGDLENKFMEFKDESHHEMRSIRSEIVNVTNSTKSIAQQSLLLKDDLSQALLDIEKQRKEQSKQLEKIGLNLDEETEKFQLEVQRLQTLMKKRENLVQELETKSNEIRSLVIEENETKFRDCIERIDSLNKQVEQLVQQVLDIFSIIDRNKKEVKDYPKNIVVNEPNHVNSDTVLNAQTEDLQPTNIYNKMSSLEMSVKKISDTFQQMIPIINRNATQNRYRDRNRNSHKQESTKSKIKILQFSDEDDYISRTSSSLLSSSSISEPKNRSQAGKRQMYKKAHQRLKSHSNKMETHSSQIHECCIHKDRNFYLPERNYHLIKVPLMTSPNWEQQQSQFKHIKTSSSSLLNLIKKTTKKLREEAVELESLGNYHFISDFNTSLVKDDNDGDEATIKQLKSVRVDVDQKLRKLTNVINQQKSSQI